MPSPFTGAQEFSRLVVVFIFRQQWTTHFWGKQRVDTYSCTYHLSGSVLILRWFPLIWKQCFDSHILRTISVN